MPEIPFELLAAALTLGGGALAIELVPKLLRRLLKRSEPSRDSYGEKLSRLTGSLTKASSEIDEVLNELAGIARHREQAIKKLEIELGKLEGREKQLQHRIQELENVPLPVAEHFAQLIAAGEKRSALRDTFYLELA
jgi:chromosome segregation ATPase